MPSEHARLSASSASRWINCPGSIALSELCPDTSSNSYAEEGTIAHSLGELKLRKAEGEISPQKYAAELRKIKKSPYCCGEMEEATDYYVDMVIEAKAAAGEDAELMIEQKFSLAQWIPEGFGTSDAVVIGGGAIQVIDLKCGKGVKVSAEGNPQLRLYGLGAAGLFSDLYDFDTVRMTIIQPRLDHISTEELPLKDLLEWAETIVVPRAQAAFDGMEVYETGDWCRFCPAKATCRKRADHNLELAKADFKLPPLLSDEEIADVLKRADELTHWVKDVSDYALAQALDGHEYPGWKLVEGRSVRKYVDDLKVAEALQSAGYDEAMLYEKKLYGITAMERIVGKKRFAEILGDLVIRPQGKPVLAPESDKRKAFSTAEKAAEDFKEESCLQK